MTDSTRRDFLKATAAGGAILAANWATRSALAAEAGPSWPKLSPAKIYKVYAGRTGDAYLTRPTAEIDKFEKYFADLQKKLGDVEFIGGDLVPPAETARVAEKLKNADALMIVHLSGHGGDAPVLSKLVDVGLPTALFSQPFSGHGWMYFPQWRKDGRRVVLLPTSDWSELDQVVGLLRVPAWMRQTRILVIGNPKGTAAALNAELLKQKLGVTCIPTANECLMELYLSIDPKAAEAEAEDYWLTQARKIVEPKRDEIIASARLYLAVKQLMIEEKAQAITSSHCMGDPRGCLTFSKLNDQGFVGACEGDVDSTLTMLIFAYAFHVPGFITDPVVDTSQNALIHFHCTSATKMDGPSGKRLPFTIRNQTDTKGGVALQVEYRVGQSITCAKLVNLDTMLVSPGKIIGTSTDPLACRTQFTTRVPDANRMFLEWGAGVIKADVMTLLHRVIFYGDHVQPIRRLGDLMGFNVIEEGGAA